MAFPRSIWEIFNLDEEQLEGWLFQNELYLSRRDREATVSGPLGRSIDHVAVQSMASFLVESVQQCKCAWKPHYALLIELTRRPLKVEVQQLVVPARLPITRDGKVKPLVDSDLGWKAFCPVSVQGHA